MAEGSWSKLSGKEKVCYCLLFLFTILVYMLVGLLIYLIAKLITNKTNELRTNGRQYDPPLILTVPEPDEHETVLQEEMPTGIFPETTTKETSALDEDMVTAIIVNTPHEYDYVTSIDTAPTTDLSPTDYTLIIISKSITNPELLEHYEYDYSPSAVTEPTGTTDTSSTKSSKLATDEEMLNSIFNKTNEIESVSRPETSDDDKTTDASLPTKSSEPATDQEMLDGILSNKTAPDHNETDVRAANKSPSTNTEPKLSSDEGMIDMASPNIISDQEMIASILNKIPSPDHTESDASSSTKSPSTDTDEEMIKAIFNKIANEQPRHPNYEHIEPNDVLYKKSHASDEDVIKGILGNTAMTSSTGLPIVDDIDMMNAIIG